MDYVETVNRLAENARKFANNRVKPDIPPGPGMTNGKRSEANGEAWNRVYWMRNNSERKRLNLPYIPLERFEQ